MIGFIDPLIAILIIIGVTLAVVVFIEGE